MNEKYWIKNENRAAWALLIRYEKFRFYIGCAKSTQPKRMGEYSRLKQHETNLYTRPSTLAHIQLISLLPLSVRSNSICVSHNDIIAHCWRYVVLICYLVALTPCICCAHCDKRRQFAIIIFSASWNCESSEFIYCYNRYTCVMIILESFLLFLRLLSCRRRRLSSFKFY